MLMSSSSNYSSREYKSTDDSMQNISENSENSEVRHRYEYVNCNHSYELIDNVEVWRSIFIMM